MGVKRASADTREDDGSDGSNESIRLRDRSTFDRPTYDRPPYDRPTYDRPTSDRPPSGRRLSTRPRYPEMMQQPTQGSLEPARGSFVGPQPGKPALDTWNRNTHVARDTFRYLASRKPQFVTERLSCSVCDTIGMLPLNFACRIV
jgi:hypothetical protein